MIYELEAGGSNHTVETEADDDAKDINAAPATSTSNRPKVHDLFHLLKSIPMRGLPKYHATDA